MLSDFIINIENFEKIRYIDSGKCGKVYLVKEQNTENYYACKVGLNQILTEADQKILFSELEILSKTNNPAVLSLRGFSTTDFDHNSYPIILIDYMKNGSLDSLLDKERHSLAPPEWDNTTKYINILGVALGMKYLNLKKIIHRDLKPANVLLDENYRPRISDFGFSKLSEDKNLSSIMMSTTAGTPLYMAPEILEGKKYDFKVDVYSYSLIVYEIITGKLPIIESNNAPYILMQNIIGGKRPDTSMIDNEGIKNFIQKCWSGDPKERPSFSEIVDLLLSKNVYSTFDIDEDAVNSYLYDFGEELKKQEENEKTKKDDSSLAKNHNDDDIDSSVVKNKKNENLFISKKVLLMGKGPCGKTSIILHLINRQFEFAVIPTIGIKFNDYEIQTNTSKVFFQIWDSSGAEIYHGFTYAYYRYLDSIIIVLDATCRSYEKSSWKQYLLETIEEIRKVNTKVLIYVDVNKCDIEIKIDLDELKSVIAKKNCTLFMTSAKDLNSIDSMFYKVADDLLNPQEHNEPDNEIPQISKSNKNCLIA